MPLTHILFDNDGVLVDTEKLYYEACRLGLEPLGVSLTHELFAEYSLTRGVSCFEIAIERGLLSPEALPALRDERDDHFAQLIAQGDCAMPDASKTVQQLAETLTLGVVTSAKRRHFELSHAHTGMSGVFSFDYAREDYERSKPHPDPYLAALRGQRLDPAHCLVVEDSPRGLRSAIAAGLRCIAIPNPFAPLGAFAGAIACLDGIAELPGALLELSRGPLT